MNPPVHIIVSFATRPGRGSEGGVGWAFLRAAAVAAATRGGVAHAVFDARDEADVQVALDAEGVDIVLHPVALPEIVSRRVGDARTRGSYLAWQPQAKSTVAELLRSHPGASAHQVTFATASLPPALPRAGGGARTVWGPITVPSGAVHAQNMPPKLREVLGVAVARAAGRFHARSASRIIATNDVTAAHLARRGVVVEVEPNIVVEPRAESQGDDGLLVMSGLLVDRKRPWIALQALARPELAQYRLAVVGDGPLRPQLEAFVRQERLDARVEFCGRLERGPALEILARAQALVHPAIREGSPWVVGEAAAAGVPAVVFAGTGADTTARLSANGSAICPSDAGVPEFAATVSRVAGADRPAPSDRWSERRLPDLLDRWWNQDA